MNDLAEGELKKCAVYATDGFLLYLSRAYQGPESAK